MVNGKKVGIGISFARSEREAIMSKMKCACTTQHDNKLMWTSTNEGHKVQSAQLLMTTEKTHHLRRQGGELRRIDGLGILRHQVGLALHHFRHGFLSRGLFSRDYLRGCY